MAYDTPTKNSAANDQDKSVRRYIEQWKTWREDLKPYWEQINKNQEMYEFYKSEESETSSDLSLNTAFSMIESMVAKANDSTLNVNVKAKGNNDLQDFEEYVSEIIKDAIEDPDVAAYKGSFRKIKEMFTRELLVKGNAIAEVSYLYKTGLREVNGEMQKVVLADNPCISIRDLKHVVFNPSVPLDESDVYYGEKFVSYDSLKAQEEKEIEEKDEQGNKTKRKTGNYRNLDALKKAMDENGKIVDHEEDTFISAGKKIRRKVEPIHLLERWQGPKLCVIALTKIGSDEDDHSGVVIREEYDPLKTNWHPFIIAMDYKIAGRPYAYGEIDAIYKPIRAQDQALNQDVESVQRYLRAGYMVKDPQADLDAILTLIEYGGVTYGDPAGIGPIQATPPPAQAFQLHDVLQQGIERAARYSPYSAGVPNQSTDKTAGTASGIARLQAASEPNFKIKLDILEDAFAKPIGRTYFKMIGSLMGSTEVRYALLRGKNPGWVKATKGMLQGTATIGDMVTIGMIKEEEIQNPEFVQQMIYEYGLEPEEYLEDTVVFDIDWIVDVSLDDQTEADKMEKAQMETQHIMLGLQTGVPINPEKAWKYIARKQGMEDIDELLYTDEEIAQQQQEQMMAQQQQMQQEQMAKEQESQQQMAQQQMQQQGRMSELQMQQQAQMQMQEMQRQAELEKAQLEPMRI